MQIQRRTGIETFRMRGLPGVVASDVVTGWTRVINGTNYDFSRVAWEGGKAGHTLTARLAGKTTIVHQWHF